MKKVLTIFLITLILTTGCKKEEKETKKEETPGVISYYNCVHKDGDSKFKISLEFEDDILIKQNLEVEYEWGNVYGGGTTQVYEIAETEVKKIFDSEFSGVDYEFIFNESGNAIGKAKITKKQVDAKEVTIVDGTDMSEIYSKTKDEIIDTYFKHYTYCTTSNEKDWDIVVFEPLYEYTDIYLDYIDENASEYGDVMYSWYIYTKDKRIMNVVYMIDYEEGLTYSYDDYTAPTLEEALQNAKDNKMEFINNKDKYIKWLESLKA